MLLLCDRDLTPVAPIERCVRWGYAQRANELTTGEMVLPIGDPLVQRIRVPGSFVHAWDGGEDLGYFCVSGIASAKHAPRGTITYKLQGAEGTLLRCMMAGWHEIGGTDYPTAQVIAYMLSRQRVRRWEAGDCEFADNYQYNFEDTTVLESLLSLGEVLLDPYMFVFDSTETPWRVHLRRAPTEARRALVYRRGMTGLTRSMDGRVVTRLYGRGYGEGDNQLTIASVSGGQDYLSADADAIAEYGDEWDGVHVDTRQTDPETLKAHMQAILAAGSRPQVSYEAEAIDLARETGESWDDVRVHDLVLVIDEVLGEPVTVRCTGREKRDVEGDPGAVTLTLDSSRPDTAEELSEIRDKIGIHELYSQGATNMYSMQLADNADETHPLVMRFYVPGNVLRINSCRVAWKLERFRTYATMAAAGGGSTRTSQSGGGATVSIPTQVVTTEASTGGPVGGEGTSSEYTESNEGDSLTTGETALTTNSGGSESVSTGGPLSGGDAKTRTDSDGPTETGSGGDGDTGDAGGHSHTVNSHSHNLNAHKHSVSGSTTGTPSPATTVAVAPGTSSVGAHSHALGSHSHSVAQHSHGMSHYHAVNISHTHSIGAHTHDIPAHTHRYAHWHHVTVTVTIPALSFELTPHTHTLTIPEHEHKLTYGVYEGAKAETVALVIDGTQVPAEAIGEARELDVAQYLRKNDDGRVTRAAWHEIEFVPSGITRITADLFFQVFIQSRGAGDY